MARCVWFEGTKNKDSPFSLAALKKDDRRAQLARPTA
jgi:hypothetical protein